MTCYNKWPLTLDFSEWRGCWRSTTAALAEERDAQRRLWTLVPLDVSARWTAASPGPEVLKDCGCEPRTEQPSNSQHLSAFLSKTAQEPLFHLGFWATLP